jgi:hypothetical protein
MRGQLAGTLILSVLALCACLTEDSGGRAGEGTGEQPVCYMCEVHFDQWTVSDDEKDCVIVRDRYEPVRATEAQAAEHPEWCTEEPSCQDDVQVTCFYRDGRTVHECFFGEPCDYPLPED